MVEGESIVESLHLREIQVCVVDVVKHSYEDLALVSVSYCIMLHQHACHTRWGK